MFGWIAVSVLMFPWLRYVYDIVQSMPFVLGFPFAVALIWYVAQRRSTMGPIVGYAVLNLVLWGFRIAYNAPKDCPLFQSCTPAFGGLSNGYVALWVAFTVVVATISIIGLVHTNRLVNAVEAIADGQYKNGMIK